MVRPHNLLGLGLLPPAVAIAVFVEAMSWRRPQGAWKVALRLAAAWVAAYIAVIPTLSLPLLSKDISTVTTMRIGSTRVLVVEQTLTDYPCRQFETRSGRGFLERYSHNTGCLGGEGPVLVQSASNPGAEADVRYAWCRQVPASLGPVRLRCNTPKEAPVP